MTAGMAAASPNAVASSAWAMPGATTARLVVCAWEMPMKLFMMPHTVPARPTNGAVAPMVASRPVPRLILRPWAASMRSSREAMRSLTPSLPVRSAEACSSACTATRKSRAGPGTAEANAAESVCAEPSAARAARAFRLARNSSTVLASQTVQVTTEANARPAMTAFTITSADRNMPHGDRSRGSAEDRPAGGLGLLRPGRTCQREEQRRAQRHDGGTRAPALAPASAVMGEGLSGPHLRPLWLELDVGEQANARARQQHLVLGVGDAVADVGVEQVGPDQANGELLDLAGPHHGGHPAAADL